MAGEFVHTSVGVELTQAEYDSITAHKFNNQAQGDLAVAISATQISRLAVGAANSVLVSDGTDPSWSTGPTFGGDVKIADGNGLVVGHTAQVLTASLKEFQVLGTSGDDAGMTFGRWSANVSPPNFDFLKSRDPVIADGTFAIVEDGDLLGLITWYGDDGTDYGSQAAQIGAEVDGTPGTGDMPGRLVFSTTPDGAEVVTERMRIDSAGDVLIADGGGLVIGHTAKVTASRTPEVQVLGTGNDDSSMLLGRWSADTAWPELVFLKSRDPVILDGTFASVQDGDTLGLISFRPDDGSGFGGLSAYISAEIDGTPGTNDMPGRLTFATTPDGQAVAAARMRINSAGKVSFLTSIDSAAVADEVAFGRYEIGAGNTVIALSQETVVAADNDESKFSNKLQVRINGSTYFIMLTTT